jgi:hypothetical protein
VEGRLPELAPRIGSPVKRAWRISRPSFSAWTFIRPDALETATGEVATGRIRPATRLTFRDFLARFAGQPVTAAVGAMTGWRFVLEECQRAGVDVRATDPTQTSAKRDRKRRAKTDRLEARLLLELLVEDRLPESWALLPLRFAFVVGSVCAEFGLGPRAVAALRGPRQPRRRRAATRVAVGSAEGSERPSAAAAHCQPRTLRDALARVDGEA